MLFLLIIGVTLSACSNAAEESGSANEVPIETGTTIKYRLADLNYQTEYYWRVSALDEDTKDSSVSNTFRFTTK